EQYRELCKFLADEGFEHYEVSNFCKPTFYSRHNSSYWNHTPYIGFGPGSHSYYDGVRRWNKPDLSLYLRSEWDSIVESEILDNRELVNGRVVLGLRTGGGRGRGRLRTCDESHEELVRRCCTTGVSAGHPKLYRQSTRCP